jgi:hypothetical protein
MDDEDDEIPKEEKDPEEGRPGSRHRPALAAWLHAGVVAGRARQAGAGGPG